MIRALLLALLIALPARAADWSTFFEELRIDQLVQRVSSDAKPRTTAIIGVNVIPMTSGGRLLRDQTIVVRNGRIESIGPRRTTTLPADALRIDARGKYVIPGLTDAHVHTLTSDSSLLLNLMHGVTTVREMAGYPWLLRMREAIRSNRLLGPTSYVAGPLINYFPNDGYATEVKSVKRGIEVVQETKAAGYDYVKLHNVVPLPIYDAILDTARQEGLRVIGHVPHDIPVRHAIEKGQYTLEHFKGFYLDTTLELSTEDWLAAVKGADIWICPTFTTRRAGMSVEETRAFMNTPAAQLVSLRRRSRWPEDVKEEGASSARIWALAPGIFRQLRGVTDRFIAGTDSGGGYANSISGFALLDELETFESLGMPPADVLKTATVNASIALGDPAAFGTIEPGKRADLVLLHRNPLETVRNLRNPRGVMVRGMWLDRAKLESMANEIRTIYATAGADASLDRPSAQQVDALLRAMSDLSAAGWIFRTRQLGQLAELLRAAGRAEDAKRVEQF